MPRDETQRRSYSKPRKFALAFGAHVRLTGWVQSSVACDAAEWDAWYGFGVDDVINEIETGS